MGKSRWQEVALGDPKKPGQSLKVRPPKRLAPVNTPERPFHHPKISDAAYIYQCKKLLENATLIDRSNLVILLPVLWYGHWRVLWSTLKWVCRCVFQDKIDHLGVIRFWKVIFSKEFRCYLVGVV